VVDSPPSLAQASTRPRARRLLGRDWREGYVFIAPMLVLLAALIAFPFGDAIRLSFTARHGPDTVFTGLANYRLLLTDPFFLDSLKNTVVFTVFSEVFKVSIGLMAALMLHHLRRWKGIATGLVLLPWVIPTVVTAVTWRSFFDPLFGGLNDIITTLHLGPLLVSLHVVQSWPAAWLADAQLAMPAVVLVNVWKGIPFFTINFLAGLKALDSQQYEAAAVDGAGVLRRFSNVTLPGLRYVIMVTTLLSTMWTFNNFDTVWLMTQGGPGNATALYTMYSYQTAIQQLQPGLGSAAAMLVLPVSAVLIFLLARHLMPGSPRTRTDGQRSGRGARTALWIIIALVVLGVAWIDLDMVVKGAVLLAVLIVLALLLGWANEQLSVFARVRARWHSLGRVPIWIGMALLLLFVLIPVFWVVVNAFKTDNQLTRGVSMLWPQPFTLGQFGQLFQQTPFGDWFRNTVVVAMVSTVVGVVVAAIAAYALSRMQFRGGRTITGTVLLTYMMPAAMLFIPLYAILSALHVINSLWALMISYPTFTLPFACWYLMGYYRGLPTELEEAAMTDGATRLQAFRLVILPMVKPALLAVGLFTLTNAWNEFLLAFVFITNNNLMTLPVGMQSMIVGDVVPWGQLSAASIVTSVPVLIAYGYAQRFLVEGLSVGAVKG